MRRSLPPVEFLRECFIYDEASGALFWRIRPREHFLSDRECRRWNSRYAGLEAFTTVSACGHRFGAIGHVNFFAHRVIWKLVLGVEPPSIIDHKNRDPADNRWGNLREAEQAENFINRVGTIGASGVIGVRVNRQGSWDARIHKDKKYIHLGCFDSKEKAIEARRRAELGLYGEFAP